MVNGEIAHHEQFLHLPQCFQKWSAAGASKFVYKSESQKGLILIHARRLFTQ